MKSVPKVTAEKILNREFHAGHFGEKWLTDVTEMKYGASGKAYLSAILDVADKSLYSTVAVDINTLQHPSVKSLTKQE